MKFEQALFLYNSNTVSKQEALRATNRLIEVLMMGEEETGEECRGVDSSD